jgi:hypothetical protein
MAVENIQHGTIAGKLNGVMPASTPTGWRIVTTSTSRLACSLKPPLSRLGTPHANSMFSTPRATSPSASERTLPCSEVRIAASSLRRASSSSRTRNMISARRLTAVARHSGKASFAAATASSTSSAEAKATAPVTAPVAGSNTGPVRPELPLRCFPPMKWPMDRGSVMGTSRGRPHQCLTITCFSSV